MASEKMASEKRARPSEPEAVCGPEEHPGRGTKQDILSNDALERAAALFRAAGDVSRLKLLGRLADGEWCVTELAEVSGVGLSTISQQLRLLRSERIVQRRRSGKHIFYSLADRHVTDLVKNALEHAAEQHSRDEDEDSE
jgi:ArsR family transcriptional regulator, lead/cadmium/zinc/bismuth-responsive transcriptional repressor